MNTIRPALFVDGENLVLRYQAMLLAGRMPAEGVVHKKDVYVWHPGMASYFNNGFRRINYYTSVVGAEELVTNTRAEIAAQRYQAGSVMAQLVPFVYKKENRRDKNRNVDIQIVIDVMRASSADAYDLIFLASGDGDYLPLIAEAMRAGKQVFAAAFSSGLNPAIASSVDKFINLDEFFFIPENTG